MPSASKQGGTRHPQILYDNLSLTAKLPKKREFILIDDVKTTGGHLQAARSMFLDREGVCDLAVCAARTVKVQSPQIFGPDIEELADWRPTESLY
jgi:predicted amidophosphoribosyltransferase